MAIFISQKFHQENTAQAFPLFVFMSAWAAPISVIPKLISIGADFPASFLRESQVP